VSYANDRAQGIALLRNWARRTASEKGVKAAHLGLMSAMEALLQDFRMEFDVPGVRYWEHPESDCFFITAPGETLSEFGVDAGHCVELARHEFFSRQGLYNGYEDSL